jgi:hypothetical protein
MKIENQEVRPAFGFFILHIRNKSCKILNLSYLCVKFHFAQCLLNDTFKGASKFNQSTGATGQQV